MLRPIQVPLIECRAIDEKKCLGEAAPRVRSSPPQASVQNGWLNLNSTTMLPSLRPLTNVPASVLLVLAAMAIQRSVVHAQNDPNLNPPYYYWLSPGRIAGIAVGLFSHFTVPFEQLAGCLLFMQVPLC